MDEGVLITLIVLAATAAFSLLWLGIIGLLGKVSGWHALERVFPDRAEPPLDTLRFQSGRMRGVNFNNCLKFEVCPTGLRVSVLRLLGPFQRPFFVPWAQIRTEHGQTLFVKHVRLIFANAEQGSLLIRLRSFERIAARSPLRAD